MDCRNGLNGRGRLKSPGKNFYSRLAAESVREVNAMREKHGVSYSRKAMIMPGMYLNVNDLWEESQLSHDLQTIIEKYQNNLEGQRVSMDAADIDNESEGQ